STLLLPSILLLVWSNRGPPRHATPPTSPLPPHAYLSSISTPSNSSVARSPPCALVSPGSLEAFTLRHVSTRDRSPHSLSNYRLTELPHPVVGYVS
ncbi:hypothetical protein C8J57DRAFT_1319239, partial [Mycena rebaudengoi]